LPQQPVKPKVNTSPSPGLLRRIFGGPISESTQTEYPELAREWASAEMNMPQETTMTNRVGPMGALGRFLSGGAYAAANPILGSISLNRQAIEQDKQNLGDVLAHELTHMHQKPSLIAGFRKYYTPPENIPEEQEALAAESKRPVRRSDIYLPPEKRKVRY
jgi:hypothetical protein